MTIDPGANDVTPLSAPTPATAFFATRILPHAAWLEQQLADHRLERALRRALYEPVADPSFVSVGLLVDSAAAVSDVERLKRFAVTRELLEARRQIAWIVEDPDLRSALPPDTTRGRWPNMCDARLGQDWTCTRIASHTGRYAAGAGERIAAVWGDQVDPR